MGLEVRPLGVKCNIQCQYCYQNPERDAGNVLHAYDMDKMKAAIALEKSPFTMFGGEPLLMPHDDLEELFKLGFEKFGRNGIQTNGTLIDDDHVRMFERYKVNVGISIDGPGELNDVRWNGNLEKTREATATIMQNIDRLARRGMRAGLIITLHRNNATADKLPQMYEWVRELERMGVKDARLHLLEVETDDISAKYALSDEENLNALLGFYALQKELKTLRLDVYHDMRNMLLGNDERATCVWKNCDPYTTNAVQGLEGNGQKSNCGRTNKDGIDFVKSSTEGFERYLALYNTPQEHGGCQGCRFFLMCKGQCPGTSMASDWRNRTEHCEVWKGMYRHLEEEMLNKGEIPLSASPIRAELEHEFIRSWQRGQHTSMHWVMKHRTAQAAKQGNGQQQSGGSRVASPRQTRVHEDADYGMTRLDFRMPEFARKSWVNSAAEMIWSERLSLIMKAWQEIEWLTVREEVRKCAAIVASPAAFMERSAEFARHGLTAMPVSMQDAGGAYQAASVKAEAGKPFVYRLVVGTIENASRFREAFDAADDATIGEMLGYPACCRDFFRDVWVEHGMIDPTWPQALNTQAAEDRTISTPALPETNVLWRWMGVRAVPHLPCSFTCADTVALGKNFVTVGRNEGYEQEMDWLMEILSWPLEWSCMHGIAEIKTPVVKVSASTDATAHKHVVRITSDVYPEQGAQGLHFPFMRPRAPKLTSTVHFKRGLANPIANAVTETE